MLASVEQLRGAPATTGAGPPKSSTFSALHPMVTLVFGLSFWEIAMVLAVALVVLGPTKLPELARSLGRGIREFRRATEDFKSTIDEEMNKPEPAPHRKQLAAAERKEELPRDPEVSGEVADPLQPLAPDAPVVEREAATVHAHAPRPPAASDDAPASVDADEGEETPSSESKA